MLSTRRLRRALIVAAALVLAIAAVAPAAQPKAGKKYAGVTSGPVFNGFAPPVSFKVSGNKKTLVSFKYSTFGCSGFGGGGGLKPGVNYYLQASAVQKLGSIPVSKSGSFSIKNVVRTYSINGQKTITTSSVKGKFKTPKKATGKITFSQTFNVPGANVPPCGPVTVSFTATTK
jgi:hypothetical protein